MHLKPLERRQMRIGLYCISVFSIIFVGVFAYFSLQMKEPASFIEVMNGHQVSDILILDRNDFPLETIRVRNQERSLAWTPWSQVSPSFQKLLIESEDKRFFRHGGIDFLAMLHSIWQTSFKGTRRGASTISMQMVNLLQKSPHSKAILKTLKLKVQQILLARKLERTWSKNQILEAYINKISFRGELVGIGAASFGYFNKSPAALNEVESATLIALIRSPNASPEKVGRRLCQILPGQNCKLMQENVLALLNRDYHIARSMDHLPVVSKYIFENHKMPSNNENMKSSLDLQIQDYALQVLREQLHDLKNKNVNEAAVLILDTKTGEPMAYVGSPGASLSASSQVDGIQARRQVGSTIKAFIYASAFDLNLLKIDSLLEDSRADIPIEGGGVYHPRNYDHTFRGNVGAGEALASSLNVPAVRTLALVGERRVLDNLKLLGFTNLEDENFYGPSLALGSLDASLWELTKAYRELAVGSVFSKLTTDQIFQALALPEYRRLSFGLENVLTLPFLAAVKTGTSKDMRDNWCVGWTSEYTIGVWVGNFNGQPMWNVSGVTGAAPIWRKLMLALHPNPPVQLQNAHYMAPEKAIAKRSISRIRYPVEDMRVALDPDIPVQFQKMSFEIENPQKGQNIFLNGLKIGSSKGNFLWSLKKGKQSLALKSVKGEVLDQVKFEVR